MAGNGRRCRSRWDNAADVAQTVRAGALSPQDLMIRPASGWLTALLKRDVEQLKEAVAAPRTVECGSGHRWAAYRDLVAKCAPDGFRESLVRVSGGSIAPKPSRWPVLANWRHTRATATRPVDPATTTPWTPRPRKWRMVIRKWSSVFGALP
jgi:hypothetical protein